MHTTKPMLLSTIFKVLALLTETPNKANTLKIAENSIDFVICMRNPFKSIYSLHCKIKQTMYNPCSSECKLLTDYSFMME